MNLQGKGLLVLLSGVIMSTCAVGGLLSNANAPRFLTQPEDEVIVFEHGSPLTSSVELQCQVENLGPDLKVSWVKNDIVVSDDYKMRNDAEASMIVDYRYSITDNGESGTFNLRIVAIDISKTRFDAGSYYCAVLSRADEVSVIQTRIATITIYVTPRSSDPECRYWSDEDTTISTTFREGQSITLACDSDLGDPPAVSLTWSSPQGTLPATRSGSRNDGRTYIEVDLTLSSENHGVLYTCTSRHPGYGHQDTADFRECTLGPLNVQYKPEVTVMPTSVTVTDVTDTVTFTCQVSGNPTVTALTWTCDDRLVTDNVGCGETMPGQRGRVSLRGFSGVEDGQYSILCEAENDLGSSIGVGIVIVRVVAATEPERVHTGSPRTDDPFSATTYTLSSLSQDYTTKKNNSTVVIVASVLATLGVLCLIILITCIVFRMKKTPRPFSTERNITISVHEERHSFESESVLIEKDHYPQGIEVDNASRKIYDQIQTIERTNSTKDVTTLVVNGKYQAAFPNGIYAEPAEKIDYQPKFEVLLPPAPNANYLLSPEKPDLKTQDFVELTKEGIVSRGQDEHQTGLGSENPTLETDENTINEEIVHEGKHLERTQNGCRESIKRVSFKEPVDKIYYQEPVENDNNAESGEDFDYQEESDNEIYEELENKGNYEESDESVSDVELVMGVKLDYPSRFDTLV